MRSLITWTVGRKLAALAGLGLVIAATVGCVAVHGLSQVGQGQKQLIRQEDGRGLAIELDTNAGDLLVDGYASLAVSDKAGRLKALAADTAEPKQQLHEL